MNRRALLWITLGVIVIIGLVAVGLANNVPKAASTSPIQAKLKVGDVAPPFTLSSTGGYFDSTAQNKPILLEVFATWCPHCKRETAVLDHIYADDKDKLAMIAVNGSDLAMDGMSPESQGDIVQFAEQYHVQYPVAYDQALEVAHLYLQGGFPTIVLIDKTGHISSFHDGEEKEEPLRKRVQAVL